MADKQRNAVAARRRTRAAEPTSSEGGVDLSLMRWMLSLTPAERLEVLRSSARAMLERGRIPRGQQQKHKLGQESLRRVLEEKYRK